MLGDADGAKLLAVELLEKPASELPRLAVMFHENQYYAINDKLLLSYKMAIFEMVPCRVYSYPAYGRPTADIYNNWFKIKYKPDGINRKMGLSDHKLATDESRLLDDFLEMVPDVVYVVDDDDACVITRYLKKRRSNLLYRLRDEGDYLVGGGEVGDDDYRPIHLDAANYCNTLRYLMMMEFLTSIIRELEDQTACQMQAVVCSVYNGT